MVPAQPRFKSRWIVGDLSIGTLAQRAGVSASAVRYYERQGLLPPPPRRSGRRCYGPAELDRLRLISRARAAGLGIAELRLLIAVMDQPLRRADAVRHVARRVDGRIASLIQLRTLLDRAAGCECVRPATCTLAIEEPSYS